MRLKNEPHVTTRSEEKKRIFRGGIEFFPPNSSIMERTFRKCKLIYKIERSLIKIINQQRNSGISLIMVYLPCVVFTHADKPVQNLQFIRERIFETGPAIVNYPPRLLLIFFYNRTFVRRVESRLVSANYLKFVKSNFVVLYKLKVSEFKRR